MIVGGPDVGIAWPALFEHKALKHKSWADVVKRGVEISKPVYYAQLQIYMAYMELETALFRVVQEAVTNIAKHSRAETVLIQILEHDDRIAIEIEDDGVGFDPASLPPPAARERGLGLLGMRERVELFGGTIEIDSAPGRGTRIAIAAPIRQEVADGQDQGSHRG